MKRCVDEGTLQAYLDGELSDDAARETAAHIAACGRCAEALAEAGDETNLFASAFAPDASLVVPTANLRARVNAAVARLEPAVESNDAKESGRNFGGFLASLSGLFVFTPRRAAAFAGVAAIFVLFFSVFFVDRQDRREQTEIASGPTTAPAVPAPTKSPETPNVSRASDPNDDNNGGKSAADEGGGNVVAPGRKATRGANRKGRTPFTPVPAPKLERRPDQQFAPGEREYQTVIANLDKTIKAGESVLKPNVIADYERNIAVLDRAIEETRRVALQNPKDRDAVNFLRTAYQSKIELMTTVADSAQVATLDRD